MKRFVLYVLAPVLLFTGITSTTVFADVTTTTKPTQGPCSDDVPVLLFPKWYHGLKCDSSETTTKDDNGHVISSSKTETVRLESINDTWIIVMNIVQWLIIAGGYVSLYFIIWSGFKYIMAAGDPQKVTAAKNTITNAIIGLIIVLASVAIVQTIQAGIQGVIK